MSEITTLLLDVNGVIQFPRADFIAAIERDFAWRHGYLAFQRELLHDPGEERSLVGDGDLITIVERILPRHVEGLSAHRHRRPTPGRTHRSHPLGLPQHDLALHHPRPCLMI